MPKEICYTLSSEVKTILNTIRLDLINLIERSACPLYNDMPYIADIRLDLFNLWNNLLNFTSFAQETPSDIAIEYLNSEIKPYLDGTKEDLTNFELVKAAFKPIKPESTESTKTSIFCGEKILKPSPKRATTKTTFPFFMLDKKDPKLPLVDHPKESLTKPLLFTA
jgi:hypothetical protein